MLTSPLLLVSALLSQGLVPPRRVIEAERLIEGARMTDGSLLQQDMTDFGPDWGGGAQLYWAIPRVGSRLVVRLDVTRAGRYDVYIHFTQAPDFARVAVRLDSGPPRTFDGYATTVRPFRYRLTTAELTVGTHELSFTVSGKHPASSNYLVGIDRLELAPIRARAPRRL